ETALLEWKVQPVKSSNPCALPLTKNKVFHWSFVEEKRAFVRVELGILGHTYVRTPPEKMIPQPRSDVRTIEWSFFRGELMGAWEREIRLTHPFVSKTEATRSIPSSGSVSPPLEF